ncbi:MAG: DUF6210 family protein [Kofleriaceae bacterium]
MRRVFLNPDGTHPAGLGVIVSASTGVSYGTQCGGLATESREAEGYLVLCPAQDRDMRFDVEAELEQWFAARAPRGETADTWSQPMVDELAGIVERVVFWFTMSDGESSRGLLALDRSRLGECMEAWVPVLTPVGPGMLTFDNSD